MCSEEVYVACLWSLCLYVCRDIETPMLNHILEYQDITGDVADWMYILLGRMLYDIGTHDNWQCCLYIKGYGGTGKSTICNMISKVYEVKSVGNLGNNSERKFGIAPLLGKYLFKASEIKADMQIDQADLQQMISGEGVRVGVYLKYMLLHVTHF